MEDYRNPIMIANICDFFNNVAINYDNLYFYPSVDSVPEDKKTDTVIIDNIVAMYDSNNNVIGSLVTCHIVNKPASDFSTINDLCRTLPSQLLITLHRKVYKNLAGGIHLVEVTSGNFNDVFDTFGNETISAALLIESNCNCGVDITYCPYVV